MERKDGLFVQSLACYTLLANLERRHCHIFEDFGEIATSGRIHTYIEAWVVFTSFPQRYTRLRSWIPADHLD
jgi:hypothetical protein